MMDIIDLWLIGADYYQIGFEEESRLYNDFAEGIKELIKDGIEPIMWKI